MIPYDVKPEPFDRGERFKIVTPNSEFQGKRGSVTFGGGVGYTDDAELASHFRNLGYEVTDRAASAPELPAPAAPAAAPESPAPVYPLAPTGHWTETGPIPPMEHGKRGKRK